MKDYTDAEVEKIVELADKWQVSPETIRGHLNSIYDSNFEDDLSFIDEVLNEKALEHAGDTAV